MSENLHLGIYIWEFNQGAILTMKKIKLIHWILKRFPNSKVFSNKLLINFLRIFTRKVNPVRTQRHFIVHMTSSRCYGLLIDVELWFRLLREQLINKYKVHTPLFKTNQEIYWKWNKYPLPCKHTSLFQRP